MGRFSAPVRRTRHGVAVRLDLVEAGLVRGLLHQLESLHQSAESRAQPEDPLASLVGIGPDEPPDDPALQRLFPDGYTADPEASAEFRRFTETDLRRAKTDRLAVVLSTLGEDGPVDLTLDPEQAQAWLLTLTDLRLVLGTRLDVTEDWQELAARLSEDDPRYGQFVVYDWLTWLQELLVGALT